MQRYIFYSIIFLFLLNSCQCLSIGGRDDIYNLRFKISEDPLFNLHRWTIEQFFASGTLRTDSIEQKNGKYPLLIKNPSFLERNDWPIRMKLQQKLFLPSLSSDTAEISIIYKSLNIKQMNLIVSGLDKYENLLRSDTLFLPEEKEWTSQTISVPLRNVAFLCLYIKIRGFDDFCEQRCWLDRISIRMDGKAIESFQPAHSCIEAEILPKTEIVPLSFSDESLYHSIPELKAKRIFAVGETVHGSGTFAESALQLIKHQVQYNNCKLILLELSIEKGLSLNRYIQGDESFKIDSLVSLMKFSHNALKYKELIMWLKEYNRYTDEKVWLMGVDIELTNMDNQTSLFDYLYTLNQTQQQPVIDTLCHQVLNSNVDFAVMANFISKNTTLQSVIGNKEYDALVHCLNVSAEARNAYSRLDIRDSLMFKNARFLIPLLTKEEEKTFIYMHLGHANYKAFTPYINSYNASLGLMMKQEYGDDYYVAGLFAGKGFFSTTWIDGVGVQPMQSPPPNSFEYLLGKTITDYFYLSSLPECPAMIRRIGNAYKEEDAFEYISLRGRMDAAIYIKESQAVVLFPDISGHTNADMLEKYRKCFEKDRVKFPLKSNR
jgi:erythromycin esterase-like protein